MGVNMSNQRFDAGSLATYLVTDLEQCASMGKSLSQVVAEGIAGGVSCVQLRLKGATAAEFLVQVEALAAVVPASVPLIVNDRVDVFERARAAGLPVAGVHIGLRDADPIQVRERLGGEAVIGVSVGTVADIHRLQLPMPHGEPDSLPGATSLPWVDYFGVGPVRDTFTKKDAPPGMGFDSFETLARESSLPVVAIGGLTAQDSWHVARAGGAGMAVVSAICLARDPQRAARELRDSWRTATSTVGVPL